MEIKKRIDLVHLLPIDPIGVEIGCAEGLFSRDLLVAGVKILYMVDVWAHVPDVKGDANSDQSWHDSNFENVGKLMAPFGDRVVLLKGFSVEMAKRIGDNSLDLAYHDCGHLFHEVASDIIAYWPKLKVGGVMAFHDFEMPEYGVKEAVTQFAQLHDLEIHLIPETEIKDAGAWIMKK